MKILKSSFHFQPSDDLFPIDKFRQIPEFIKITANLKRRFVMVTTPDILTSLSLVMRLEPIGNMLWQGQIEGNQFQIIPDIFHPMNKPGYILIRYVDADTVTLIEFEEHMMGVAGFDSILGKTEETKYETDEQFKERFYENLPPADEEPLEPEGFRPEEDPRNFQVAEQVGDKYVFDPEICRPSTETCGECIHGVCCEKAKIAKAGDIRKDTQMGFKKLEPIEVQWACVAELTEKKLNDHEVPFESKDFGSAYTVRFELGKHRYAIKFKLREDLSNEVMISQFDIDPEKRTGRLIFRAKVFDPVSMNEYLIKLDSILDEEVVEELAKDPPKEIDKGQPAESDDIPVWKLPIDRIEKLLDNYRIKYKCDDCENLHYIRYENGYKNYYVCFEETKKLKYPYRAVFTNDSEGKALWAGPINSYEQLYELEQAIVNTIKPMENEPW